MIDYRQYITLQAGKRGGKPCVRGMRIAVQDILACLAWAAAREQNAAWVPTAA